MYRDTSWRNISLHQQVGVSKETNLLSIEKDPYCCKISISRVDRIGPVTVGHIPRELSRFVFYFLHEGGSVSGTVSSVAPNVSPIPEGGLEIPILMHFTHVNMVILEKMNSFVVRQVEKMKEKLDEKTLFEDDNTEDVSDEEIYEEEIIVESEDENNGDDENTDTWEQEQSQQSDKNTNNNVIVID